MDKVMIGNIAKMHTQLDTGRVAYQLPIGEAFIALNALLNKTIQLNFTGQINCVHCARQIKKTFNQGFCFPCCQRLAACDLCIVRPELCHFDQGTCREPEWAQTHCMMEHIVYLANASAVKVGITRGTQIPTRWIDQGAIQALPIYRTQSRYQSGLMETCIKQHVSDRTDWRRMLKGHNPKCDLHSERERIQHAIAQHETKLNNRFNNGLTRLETENITTIEFPVLQYPEKIKSLNFDKTPQIQGKLMGIKGQYLIFDNGVINIRKFSGYEIEFQAM